MIYVALAMLGFGVSDLVRWSPDRVAKGRVAAAVLCGVGAIALVAGLSGFEIGGVAAAPAVAIPVLLAWSAFELLPARAAKPGYALALVFGTLITAIAASGSADRVDGDFAAWYSNLDFGFVREIAVGQFLLGVGAAVFLLATGNRIVRFMLATTEQSLVSAEGTLRGGRALGPMERPIVAAGVISGGAAAAAFVIAGKGLLRFREIRGQGGADHAGDGGIDEITEYFLVGTFASVLLAAAVGVVVLAAG